MKKMIRAVLLAGMSCVLGSGSLAEVETRLLTGEKIRGPLGTLEAGRIPFATGWSSGTIPIPVRHLLETKFDPTSVEGPSLGYQVVLTNQDRVLSSFLNFDRKQMTLVPSWGDNQVILPSYVQAVWKTSPSESDQPKWHSVLPDASWWFHVERGKTKKTERDWKPDQDGNWIFVKDRIMSGLNIPANENGLQFAVEFGQTPANFRVILADKMGDLKNNASGSLDLVVNSSQLLIRHRRKFVYRKQLSQMGFKLNRVRFEMDLQARTFKLWGNDVFMEEVKFPDTLKSTIPSMAIVDAFSSLQVNHFELMPLTKDLQKDSDILWLQNGQFRSGILESWGPETGIQFREDNGNVLIFQEEEVSGIRGCAIFC